jgi:hypothetical protein
MLTVMIQFDLHRPDLKVGMLKSAFFVASDLAKLRTPMARDQSTAKKYYWDKYKNASHLWGALLYFEKISPGAPINFTSILDIAEQLVSLGKDLVDDWDPWRFPQQLAFETPIKVEFPPPDAEDKKLMTEYFVGAKVPRKRS